MDGMDWQASGHSGSCRTVVELVNDALCANGKDGGDGVFRFVATAVDEAMFCLPDYYVYDEPQTTVKSIAYLLQFLSRDSMCVQFVSVFVTMPVHSWLYSSLPR